MKKVIGYILVLVIGLGSAYALAENDNNFSTNDGGGSCCGSLTDDGH